MFWVIFILIWVCSLAIHIAMVYHEDKHVIFNVGNLIDKMEFYMWFPLINTLTLIGISVAFIAVGTATLLKLDVLWEKFRNIKLK